MRIISVIISLALLLLIAAAVFTGFGFYNVAANRPDYPAVAWWVAKTMDSSVQRHADNSVPFPPALDDPQMIQAGAKSYVEEGCVDCHGGVGVKPAEFTKGMNPEPPELVETAAEWDDRELFWIVQNGIRMTAMPAFGASHDPQSLWSIVSFVRELPKMSEEDFKKLVPSIAGHLDRQGEDEGKSAEAGGNEAASQASGDADRGRACRVAGRRAAAAREDRHRRLTPAALGMSPSRSVRVRSRNPACKSATAEFFTVGRTLFRRPLRRDRLNDTLGKDSCRRMQIAEQIVELRGPPRGREAQFLRGVVRG